MNDYGFGGIDGRDMAIRELEDRGAAYRQRIADLEAQVTRLQDYAGREYARLTAHFERGGATPDYAHTLAIGRLGIEPGDLDPVKGGNDAP